MLLFDIYIIIHTLKRNSNRQISTITFQINSNEKKREEFTLLSFNIQWGFHVT